MWGPRKQLSNCCQWIITINAKRKGTMAQILEGTPLSFDEADGARINPTCTLPQEFLSKSGSRGTTPRRACGAMDTYRDCYCTEYIWNEVTTLMNCQGAAIVHTVGYDTPTLGSPILQQSNSTTANDILLYFCERLSILDSAKGSGRLCETIRNFRMHPPSITKVYQNA